jgi:uncharacterized protein YecE (DUF72 family)
MSSTMRCGPAGWSYPHWNGVIYPRPKPRGFHPLEFLSQSFDTIEINTSFYQALRPEIARLWICKVSHNPAFRFGAKLNRRFTHERMLDTEDILRFKQGLRPLLEAKRLGYVLMQFPWSFRYTKENKEFFIELRRKFHEFPLVAEMRHSSWMYDEALGTLIDYRVGFCNIDQPEHTNAMPATSFLTTSTACVRLHGRSPGNLGEEFDSGDVAARPHNYYYTPEELEEWKERIQSLRQAAESIYVIFNNDGAGRAVLNALEFQELFDGRRRTLPRAFDPQQSLFLDRAVA